MNWEFLKMGFGVAGAICLGASVAVGGSFALTFFGGVFIGASGVSWMKDYFG